MRTMCVAGIDVSKARLDVFVLPDRISLEFDNVPEGIDALVSRLKRQKVERVVVEATGGLEYPAARALSDGGIAVSRVPRGRCRRLRSFLGSCAKTEARRAELIARFALAMPADVDRAIARQRSAASRRLIA